MVRIAAISTLLFCSTATAVTTSTNLELFDATSGRRIPLLIYPPSPGSCSARCPVAIFGTGYQIKANEYSFIGNALAASGYLTVVVQYDLPDDFPMPNTGNINSDRGPFWRRGVTSLLFILSQLPERFPTRAWTTLTAVGHSQGGDIAALFASEHPEWISALITLDNRRVPLPRNVSFPILSLRSSDQLADPAVLPAATTTSCILRLPETKHDDMTDNGPQASKSIMANAVLRFLKEQQCRL
jgi:pimeloyl-ACP methyl ester carboxylesterase